MNTNPSDKSATTTEAGVPYSLFAGHRASHRKRFGDHFRLPIVRSHLALATDGLSGELQSVLDCGATDRKWKSPLQSRWPEIDYRSCDLDRSQRHDFYDWKDIDRKFDLVLCIEIMEHLAPVQALELARLAASVCNPAGYVLATVPNTYTPGYQLEFTHRTAFGFVDLAGLLSLAGLRIVSAARVAGERSRWSRFLHGFAFHWLHRFLRIDFCQSVAVLAQREKPEGREDGRPN